MRQRLSELTVSAGAASSGARPTKGPATRARRMGEVVSRHAMLGLQMADHQFDGRAAAQLAFDGLGNAPFLARDRDLEAMLGRRVVAAIAAVGDDALYRCADLLLHLGEDDDERVAVVLVAGRCLHMGDELAALGRRWTLLKTGARALFLIFCVGRDRRRVDARAAWVFRCRRTIESAERSWRKSEAFAAAADFEMFRADLVAALGYLDGAQGRRPPALARRPRSGRAHDLAVSREAHEGRRDRRLVCAFRSGAASFRLLARN